MATDQSALLELLDALKAADVDDRVRLATQNLYEALIDDEARSSFAVLRAARSRDVMRSGRDSL